MLMFYIVICQTASTDPCSLWQTLVCPPDLSYTANRAKVFSLPTSHETRPNPNPKLCSLILIVEPSTFLTTVTRACCLSHDDILDFLETKLAWRTTPGYVNSCSENTLSNHVPHKFVSVLFKSLTRPISCYHLLSEVLRHSGSYHGVQSHFKNQEHTKNKCLRFNQSKHPSKCSV
ncbi:hypothetical protein ILYODFUR_027460 [Ilyodon furcidens]|uniref:Uncharacterized protein n=1 Tax=Ilyodon furcidens TaxID=33524 RepID=A0ABV0UY03_9TELE